VRFLLFRQFSRLLRQCCCRSVFVHFVVSAKVGCGSVDEDKGVRNRMDIRFLAPFPRPCHCRASTSQQSSLTKRRTSGLQADLSRTLRTSAFAGHAWEQFFREARTDHITISDSAHEGKNKSPYPQSNRGIAIIFSDVARSIWLARPIVARWTRLALRTVLSALLPVAEYCSRNSVALRTVLSAAVGSPVPLGE